MGIFDRFFRKKAKAAPVTDEEFRWYDPGPENPFGLRFLDCRPLTQTVSSWTKDPQIAERYDQLRHSDGKDLINAVIPDAVRCPAALVFPHDGTARDGGVFKSPEMEVKWDVYLYDSVFLFARSWTGELQFRAFAEIEESEIRITSVECQAVDRELAASHVFFILATHVLKRVIPHQLPAGPIPLSDKNIAVRSFGLFGRYAWYATQEEITGLPLAGPPQGEGNSKS